MRVPISNPAWGGQRFTSAKRAAHFLRRRVAVMNAAGYLVFLAATERARDEESEWRRNRGDRIYWQGSYKGPTLHRPGEVRC